VEGRFGCPILGAAKGGNKEGAWIKMTYSYRDLPLTDPTLRKRGEGWGTRPLARCKSTFTDKERAIENASF